MRLAFRVAALLVAAVLAADVPLRRRIRRSPSRSSCRSPPAARPTSWRARSGRSSPSCGASRSIVDNRPGAGGTIGAGDRRQAPRRRLHAARAFGGALASTRRSIRDLPFDTRKDFVEIAPLGGQPNVLVVAPSTGIKSVQDLVAQAKQKPGSSISARRAPAAARTSTREKFKLAAGIDVVHVPYKGTPEALTDTMAGRVTYLLLADLGGAAARAGRQAGRARGVERTKRSSALPRRADDRRIGRCRGFDYNLWVGLFGPAAMPADIVDKINKDVQRALATPEIKERLANSAPSRCR